MEIPEISMIAVFEATGMKCLHTQSLISWVFSLSNLNQVFNFCKWSAIILAIFATFRSISRRIKIIHIRRIKSSSESLLQHLDIDLDLSDDDDDTKDSSPASSDDEEGEEIYTPSFHDRMLGGRGYEDFSVKGSSHLRLRRNRRGGGEGFGWGDFTTGKNVVKLWDSLGLSLGFDSFDDSSDSESVVSLWDFNKEKKISDVLVGLRHSPVFSSAAASRPVVLSAKMNDKRNGVVLGGYDTRMGGKAPAFYAEWDLPNWPAAKVGGLKVGGVEKVYVRDDVNGVLTVGDVRKVKTPLETVTETDGDM